MTPSSARLQPTRRPPSRTACSTGAIIPIYNSHQVSFDNTNGYVLQLSAEGIGSLALTGDRTVTTYLNAARAGFETIYDDADIDGGWGEGTCYGGYSMDNGTQFAYFDTRITATNGWAHPYLSEVGRFCWQVLNPAKDQFVNFARQPWPHPPTTVPPWFSSIRGWATITRSTS